MQVKTLAEHLDREEGPKRILSLDGGGVRGIVSLAFLARIEEELRLRNGNDPAFRLCHYFDLIGGTSTGAIIAGALAMGKTVKDIRTRYMKLCRGIFKKKKSRKGIVRPKFEKGALEDALRGLFGEHTTLETAELKTGLMVMTKRLDTNSAWPLNNNPEGKYFEPRKKDQKRVPNKDYPLWRVIRASTAAPGYFKPEKWVIVEGGPGQQDTMGEFVDGGVSTANNPALQLLMLATLEGYNLRWPLAENELLLLSVGTGTGPEEVAPHWTHRYAAKHAVNALLSLMTDCNDQVETVMQWLSTSPTARKIDREIGDLSPKPDEDRPRGDLLAGANVLTSATTSSSRPRGASCMYIQVFFTGNRSDSFSRFWTVTCLRAE